jgi:hypothetical protein
VSASIPRRVRSCAATPVVRRETLAGKPPAPHSAEAGRPASQRPSDSRRCLPRCSTSDAYADTGEPAALSVSIQLSHSGFAVRSFSAAISGVRAQPVSTGPRRTAEPHRAGRPKRATRGRCCVRLPATRRTRRYSLPCRQRPNRTLNERPQRRVSTSADPRRCVPPNLALHRPGSAMPPWSLRTSPQRRCRRRTPTRVIAASPKPGANS